MCFSRYHHFLHVNPSSSSFIVQIYACGTIFPFGIFGSPDLRVSILFVLLAIPQSRTSQYSLSPSFVALVKSSLAPFYFPSLVLSPCLAAVPACVLCVCFACVSMSNDSIPHWPMHDSPFVDWWLIHSGFGQKLDRKCSTHPNNE